MMRGSGFWLVFWREFRWLYRRPFLFALTTVVPLFLMALLAFVFSAGLATRLPIAVLDLDDSSLSRSIVRTVDATPDVAVKTRVAELADGRHRILTGEVYGLLMLPRNLERDVLAGRRPEVVFFYNTQKMTTGNLALRGINNALPTIAAGIKLSLRTAHGQPIEQAQANLTPIPVQINALFNPTLNYVHFLLAALIPSLLQIVVVTTMAYSVSLDFRTPHRLRILRRLAGGLWPGFMGKILPYTLLFLCLLGIADAVLFGVLELPLRGSRWLLLLGSTLFILACQMIGTLLALMLPGNAISIATLITAPAFGFMGIGFPRHGMNSFAYSWGELLPGTWYLMARIDQTIRGTPFELSLKPIFVLAAFVAVLGGLVALRLEIIRANTDSREARASRARAAPA